MSDAHGLRAVSATRYVAPLREGGSLPGLMEASDDGLYVVKFTAAGQGSLALVAEVIAAELMRALGLSVPDLVTVELDAALGVAEPDPEIQELIVASAGTNLGVDFLPSAQHYSPGMSWKVDASLAAEIVWLDAFLTNVDRTARNANLLIWHERLWMIDHGAALYAHHTGLRPAEHALLAFPQIADHVLLPEASSILDADTRLAPKIDLPLLERVVSLVPDVWLTTPRTVYVDYLSRRLDFPRAFVNEAEDARSRV